MSGAEKREREGEGRDKEGEVDRDEGNKGGGRERGAGREEMQRGGEGGEGDREGGRQKYTYEWCEAGVSIYGHVVWGHIQTMGCFLCNPKLRMSSTF